jgi:hypothetical protein
MANRSGELFVREEGSVCYKSKDRGSTEGKDVSLARFEATDNAPYSIPTHFYPFLWVPLSLVRLAKWHLGLSKVTTSCHNVWSQREAFIKMVVDDTDGMAQEFGFTPPSTWPRQSVLA